MIESTRLQQALNDVTAIRQPIGSAPLPAAQKRRLLVVGGLAIVVLIATIVLIAAKARSGSVHSFPQFGNAADIVSEAQKECLMRKYGGTLGRSILRNPELRAQYLPCR